jgi:hypothetical protein
MLTGIASKKSNETAVELFKLILSQIPVIFKGDPLEQLMEQFLDIKGKLKIWLLSF